jgi:hypothetical protein
VLQPKFALIPKSATESAVVYTADFKYFENLGPGQWYITVVEDVKGVKTQAYIIKRKLFKLTYPNITFREIEA